MKRFVFIFVLTSSISGHFACKNKDQNSEPQFYYFPKTNVYYNALTKNYSYSLDGGKTWSNYKGKFDNQDAMGKKILFKSSENEVWKNNENHRKLYAGSLYNIKGINTVEASTVANVVTERAVKKSAKASTPKARSSYKKEKKPIKTFFRKIFGKRKANN